MKKTPLQPASAPPEPPAGLSDASLELWRGVIHKCMNAGRRELLHQACRALDRAEEARAIVASEGLTSKTQTTGAIHLHPALKIELEARRQFVNIMGALELSNRWQPGNNILGPIEAS